jgi:hypothetical protein
MTREHLDLECLVEFHGADVLELVEDGAQLCGSRRRIFSEQGSIERPSFKRVGRELEEPTVAVQLIVIFELNQEGNNATRKTGFLDVMPIPFADLVVTSISPPRSAFAGRQLEFSWMVSYYIGQTESVLDD